MAKDECSCHERKDKEGCTACRGDQIFAYWCSSCDRAVAEKRCPYCGLKAQKRG